MSQEPRIAAVVASVETTLRAALPDVEVWDVQVEQSRGIVRVLLERPGGVDLATCEAATKALADLRQRYALEVSSPGIERPLVRPDHYARSIGETVRVRLRAAHGGRRTIDGALLAANESRIVVGAEAGEIEIPLDEIERSTVVWKPVETR